MKKMVSLLLVLTMLCALCPALAADEIYNGFFGGSQTVFETIPSSPAAPSETLKASETVVEPAKKEDTKPLATDGVEVPAGYSMPYVIKVDTTNQIMTILKYSSYGRYDTIAEQFVCSTGKKSDPTPEGVFTLSDASRKEWRYFKTYRTYVRYGVHIFGNYFIHSLLYSKPDATTTKYRSSTSYKNLGKKASHGCIRLYDDNCKWVFENCGAGTLVYVMDCEKNSDLTKQLKKNLGK